MKNHKSILFLAPYPQGYGPSQRFRLEIYFKHILHSGLSYEYQTFYSRKSYDQLYKTGGYMRKAFVVMKGFFHRFLMLFTLNKFDYVFIQREITPMGPPIFEWLISKVFRKKIIYDFDDAIWLPNYSQENALFQRLKSYWKVKHIIKWSYKVVAGNQFLANYAKEINPYTEIIPTIVDTVNHHHAPTGLPKSHHIPIIGWTGTLTTNLHIESLVSVFKKLNEAHKYKLLLISNKKPAIDLPNVIYQKWDKENEIEQLLQIDIGLMPLKSDHSFYQGKCGFKAIQYMSLGITTVVSPIGVNKLIVDDGSNGFHAVNHLKWFEILDKLLHNIYNQEDIADHARKKIQEHYSLLSTQDKFLKLFK